MRVLFYRGVQKEFLVDAIKIAGSRQTLTSKLDVSVNTLKKWVSEERTLPYGVFVKLLAKFPELDAYKNKIVEIRNDNWGQIKGGKKSINAIKIKFGYQEIKKRQRNGGLSTAKKFKILPKMTPKLIEFLGILYGDGWLGKYSYKNKKHWWVGVCGNSVDDKEYLKYVCDLTLKLFGRKPYYKEKKNVKAGYIILTSKSLVNYFQDRFGFPIGLKKGRLKIHDNIKNSNWEMFKNFIRGLFDTDGSIYWDKNIGYKKPYPIIEITSIENEILDYISKRLNKNGFTSFLGRNRLILKGFNNLELWKKEIKPSNSKHIKRMMGP